VRPENLQVQKATEGNVGVRVIEHLGAMTVGYLAAPTTGVNVELRAILPEGVEPTAGDRVSVSVSAPDVLFWP
jgi:hypothetical protein